MKRTVAWLFLLLLPVAAGADWLAFKDGTTTETKGPWKIQGRRVVFTSTSGTLTAARLDEIDLAASEQLSQNAASDRKLVEIKSSPTELNWWRQFDEYDNPTLLSAGGQQFVSEKQWDWSQYPKSHKGQDCVLGRLVGISTGVVWWLQIGTKVSKFRPVGLETADLEHLKALVPDGLVCYKVDPLIKSPDAAGNVVGYAHLPDGRDIGLELIRSRAARLNSEEFSERKQYLAAAKP